MNYHCKPVSGAKRGKNSLPKIPIAWPRKEIVYPDWLNKGAKYFKPITKLKSVHETECKSVAKSKPLVVLDAAPSFCPW